MAIGLFAFFRPPTAAALTFIAGSMLLPAATAVDFRVVPAIGKEEVISISALFAAYVFAGSRMHRARLGRGLESLVGIAMVSMTISVFTNLDALPAGPITVPAAGPTTFVSGTLELAIRWGIPFFVGRAMFTHTRDARLLLVILAVAGFIYSFPILLELRISPQLHRYVYGFHQHSFAQTKRGDGYRPMVFMAHGLNLSLFIVMCMAAAAALTRTRQKILGLPTAPLAIYLAIILVACKSTGSTLYGMLIAPMVLFAPAKLQLRVACILALIIFSYPILRTYDVLPFERATELAVEYSGPRRAASLSARLETEQTMMERIRERSWFGWASAGRSALRDPNTGALTTTFDGFWIIALSRHGGVGCLMLFAMLLLPVFTAARALPRIRSRHDRAILGALSLMVVINVFDLIPNSTVEGYLTLLSGALAGLVPGMLREQSARRRRRANRHEAPPNRYDSAAAGLLGPQQGL